MKRLTEHFTFEELTVTEMRVIQDLNREQALDFAANIEKTAQLLEKVRTLLGQPLIVTSGFRCPVLNQLIGGSPTSQHMAGLAADFRGNGWTDPPHFRDAMNSIQNSGLRFHQLLLEHGCLHISVPNQNDILGEVAFWNLGVKKIIRAGLSA
jgi:uncharacterized protein YcbK (DUF882 family)